ncbi:MAG: prepilin-type N-terminal cleavage/methylation domain-containing protein [Oscillospiraceae bacterium]|nr:prepilin-type N-terminal cleavage/methylation domain-containing protein [Oscillospiraceae bacterium]
MKKSSMRVKGFTLTEMIIVIAIIGILAAILAPTMTTYYWKSRVKSANGDAKMVYNAAQTAAQRFIAKDQPFRSGTLADANRTSGLENVVVIRYENNAFSYSITGFPYAFGTGASTGADEAVAEIVASVNRTVSGAEQKCWTVQIHNYIVEGCIAAENETSDLVGYYTTGVTCLPNNRPGKNYSNWFASAETTAATEYPASFADVVSRYSTTTPVATTP